MRVLRLVRLALCLAGTSFAFDVTFRIFEASERTYTLSIDPDGEVTEQIDSFVRANPETQNGVDAIRESVERRLLGIQLKEKVGLDEVCSNLITDIDAAVLHEYVNVSLSTARTQSSGAFLDDSKAMIYAETGSYMGCSSILMASMLPPGSLIYAHDLWVDVASGESLSEDGLPPLNYTEVDNYFYRFYDNVRQRGLESTIIPIRGDSSFTLGLHQEESLTFGFIDGDHSYEGVTRDLTAMYPRIKPGGVLLLHDVMNTGDGIMNDAAKAMSNFCSLKDLECEYHLAGTEIARVYRS